MLGEGYKVTEEGKVLSAWKRGVKFPTDSYRELSYGKDGKGYLQVSIIWNKKRQTKRIHRLVAELYIENLNNLPCIRHKDGNKENNSKENLAWCDYLENEHDKKNHGTWKKRLGSRKLSDKEVSDIRQKVEQGWEQIFLAQAYNVSRPTINRIANRKIWREF
jgi:hypothetical protein